jgi:hypothetical protein
MREKKKGSHLVEEKLCANLHPNYVSFSSINMTGIASTLCGCEVQSLHGFRCPFFKYILRRKLQCNLTRFHFLQFQSTDVSVECLLLGILWLPKCRFNESWYVTFDTCCPSYYEISCRESTRYQITRRLPIHLPNFHVLITIIRLLLGDINRSLTESG